MRLRHEMLYKGESLETIFNLHAQSQNCSMSSKVIGLLSLAATGVALAVAWALWRGAEDQDGPILYYQNDPPPPPEDPEPQGDDPNSLESAGASTGGDDLPPTPPLSPVPSTSRAPADDQQTPGPSEEMGLHGTVPVSRQWSLRSLWLILFSM
mgnify:CR=1 FL=1